MDSFDTRRTAIIWGGFEQSEPCSVTSVLNRLALLHAARASRHEPHAAARPNPKADYPGTAGVPRIAD